MKRKLMCGLTAFLWLCMPLFMTAQSSFAGEEYTMPKKDGHLGEKVVDNYLTFYDMGGKSGNAPSYFAGKICFVPKNEGEQIEITFEDIDLSGLASVYVYDGQVEFDKYTAPIPENPLAKLDGQLTGQTFLSTKGSLSVLYHCKGSAGGTGWTALVKSILPKEMEYKEVWADQSAIASTYPGKKAQPIMALNVKTDGSLNPYSVSKLAFTLEGTTWLSDISNLTVYYTGSTATFGQKNLFGESIGTPLGEVAFEGTQKLASGDNYFWLVADVSATAAPSHKLDAACTSVWVDQVEKLSSPLSPAGHINIDNVVLMSADPMSYKVGDMPIAFYDDGGKDGHISENFEGQVTFEPATPGKKVKIDFTKVTLFESSNKNEILKVYNGKEAVPANLIQQVKSGELILIRSTAADGALTVTLTGDTGFPKEGFEATVSEFTPQAMTVESVVPLQYTEGTVCAGDIQQPILSFNIRTQHTEPALTTAKFSFTTGGTFPLVSKATLYYTQRHNAFGKTVKLGEAAVSADAFDIIADTPVALWEGNNYFWLAYDLISDATSGQLIDAGVTAVSLSDGVHVVADGNPEGHRVVKNEYVSQLGVYEKTVKGTWFYTSKPNPNISYNGYEPVMGEQVVTFVPATPGMVMELDFSQFNLYYASSSYGTKAKFAIYSGRDSSGEKLWELNHTDHKDKGPGYVVRSKASDGSLTVVFDAQTTSSSYTAKGWEAEIREYKPRPMQASGINVYQASTDILKAGATNQEILGFCILTEGDQQPLSWDEIVLNLKGSQDKVDKVYLYAAGRDSILVNTTPLAEAAVSAGAELKLVPEAPQVLLEGKNYYWVTYDVKESALAEQVIDGALVSVRIGEEHKLPVNGDPDGERIVKNTYNLQEGENGTVLVGSQPLVFYDHGGANGPTPKNFKGTVTFAPKEAGQVIKLIFKQWDIAANDKMWVYYGGEKKDKEDVKYSNTSKVSTLVSKAEDGKLTLSFESPSYSFQSDGWAIEVVSYTLEELSQGEVKISAVNPEKLLKGMTDVPMLRIEVEVKGDKGVFDITQFDLNPMNTASGAITAAHVYVTDTIGSFSANTKFAESISAAPYTFDGSYKVTQAGVYKFWLAYDISPQAGLYEVVEAKLAGVKAGGLQLLPSQPVTASSAVAEGFSGTYSVGEEGDYKTIAQAVDAMKGGIDAPVVFVLENGEYNECVEIPEIPGASAVNTITFKSRSGKYQDVKIYFDSYTEPAYSDDKMFYEYGVFTVSGADYLTLDGVTVTTTDLTFPSVIHVKNRSRHVTVKNCHIHTQMSTNYANDVNLVYQYAQNIAHRNNDYFTIENCLLEGGYNGIRVGGTSMVALPKQQGSKIVGNTLRNQGAKGIYVPGESELTVKENMITNTETTKTDFNAMDILAHEGVMIAGNMINLHTKNYATAIYLRNVYGTESKQAYVINNEINVNCAGTSSSSGIKLGYPAAYLNIAHNTVRMWGAANGSVAMYVNDVMNHTTILNNIFQHEAEGYVYRLYKASSLEGIVYSNNMLFSSSASLFARIGSEEIGFESWKTQSGEKESYVERTTFLSENVLEPSQEGNLNNATVLEYVPTDLNGTLRSASNPTIGAYEYADQSAAPAMEQGYPVVSGITHRMASVWVKGSLSGRAFLLVKKAAEEAPSVEEVKAGVSVELRKGKQTAVEMAELDYQTDYKCYIVLQSLKGTDSEVIQSPLFTTSYLPTRISDFEEVKPTQDGGFEDGTAAFTGFTVVDITDGVGSENTKAARIDGTGIVALTNSTKGIRLTGFYLKSDEEVALKTKDAEAVETEKKIGATNGQWVFCNLKDMGKIASLTLTAAGEGTFIDNFSGEPQQITLWVEGRAVTEGEETTLQAEVGGGVTPYAYVWKNAKGEELASTAYYTFAPQSIGEYTLKVTDAWGVSATKKTTVRVEGNSYTATFENLYLAPDSHWRGDLETGENATFYSGSYAFDNHFDKEMSAWSGFAYSNETPAWPGAEFRAVPGSGVNGSANYAVAYVYTLPTLTVAHRAQGDSIKGCYVTNTVWVKEAILNGDGMSSVPGGFAKGDYFLLTAKGLDESGSVTSQVACYLADYRSDKPADHYYLDSWQWVDLRPLGKVCKVTFSLEGTKKNSYGMTTPAYFCLDDFNGRFAVEEKTAPTMPLGKTVLPLATFFTFDDADATIAYSLESELDEARIKTTLSDDKLTVEAKEDLYSGTVLLKAVQKGKIQFVRLSLRVDHGAVSIENQPSARTSVYPVLAVDRITVSTDMDEYTIEVVAMNGTKVFVQTNNSADTTLSVSELENGMYMIRIYDHTHTVVKKFTKINK